MRADGQLERFDQINADALRLQAKGDSPTGRSRLLGQVTVDGFCGRILKMALDDYQSYHVPSENDPWLVGFPFARDLAAGHKVTNRTKDCTYKITKVHLDNEGRRNGLVSLTGAEPPKPSDRLILDSSLLLNYHHIWPDVVADTVERQPAADLGEQNRAWSDTITYRVTRDEPGTLSQRPFRGVREVSPRMREYLDNPLDSSKVTETIGQVRDSLIQFQFWGKTTEEAIQLMEWFEHFMYIHRGVFLLNGVLRVEYWERSQDIIKIDWRNDIHALGLVYYVRTERVYSKWHSRLTEIQFNLSLADSTTSTGNPISEFATPTGDMTSQVSE